MEFLSEEMIQHIQSFLNAKEAARTTIVSKLWNKSWLTRPDLKFSLSDFFFQDDFVKVTNRTLKRYEESKLKIKRFELWLNKYSNEGSSFMLEQDMICLGLEWIKKAMKLGAIDVFIGIPRRSQNFVLPREVLESESLVKLTFIGGKIDGHALKVRCSRLKSLTLNNVYIQDNNILDIISVCPLIEYLELSYCYSTDFFRRLVLKSEWGINDYWHKLKMLSLDYVEIGEWFFHALSKSPCLNYLSLDNCTSFEEIQIFSDSLESISISCSDGQKISRANFDVPRIRKFFFTHCACVPSLCFKTSSREWESLISFPDNVDSSQFYVKCRKLLSELSSSKINFELWTYDPLEEEENMIRGLPKPPVVETLSLVFKDSPFSVESNALKGLLWSCRPKAITLCLCMKPYDFARLLCYTTIKEEQENRNTSPLHDLEKVDVEFFEQIVWTWSRGCPVPTNTEDDSDKITNWCDTKVCLQWK